MARIKENGGAAERQWEAEHQARERMQQFLESERDQREVEWEEKDRYVDPTEGKERYQFMLTTAEELALSMVDLDDEQRRSVDDPAAQVEINLQMAILNDAIVDACPKIAAFEFGFDIDALAAEVDAMLARVTQEAMASIPTPLPPSRRTSRRGPGKRKTQFAEEENGHRER